MNDNLFICRVCKAYKPGKQFNTRGMDIWCSTCKECRKARCMAKKWTKKTTKARRRAKKKLNRADTLAIQRQIRSGSYVDLPQDRSGSGATYTERNANLKTMGFRNYKEYLRSPLWKGIRAKVFATKGKVCELCDRLADIVHHNWYGVSDLLGGRMCNLHPLCEQCHERIEHSNGKKARHQDARRMFDEILKSKSRECRSVSRAENP